MDHQSRAYRMVASINNTYELNRFINITELKGKYIYLNSLLLNKILKVYILESNNAKFTVLNLPSELDSEKERGNLVVRNVA